jgi:hypothetical protein
MKLVAIMLGRYPGTNARDPAGYVDALAGALCDQPREIAIACAAPNGVAVECMFKPTVADIARWCEREGAPYVERMREQSAQIAAENALANAPRIVDRSGRPTFDELRAKHGPTWGLKTIVDLERDEAQAADDRRNREMRDRQVLAEYAALGIDPVYASDGALASPSLLRSINRMPRKHDNAPVDHSDR